MTYANGTFVAVRDRDISTSPDGVTWTPRSSGTYDRLYSVANGNDTFVAVGASSAISTSPDGITWTSKRLGTTPSTIPDFFGVTYGSGIFVVVGGPTILTSPDGVIWTSRMTAELNGVTYGNGTFVAVGYAGAIVQSAPVK